MKDLSLEEKEDVYKALIQWSNWVETGNMLLNSSDLKNMKKPAKHLSQENMEKIIHLRNLAEKFL